LLQLASECLPPEIAKAFFVRCEIFNMAEKCPKFSMLLCLLIKAVDNMLYFFVPDMIGESIGVSHAWILSQSQKIATVY